MIPMLVQTIVVVTFLALELIGVIGLTMYNPQ